VDPFYAANIEFSNDMQTAQHGHHLSGRAVAPHKESNWLIYSTK